MFTRTGRGLLAILFAVAGLGGLAATPASAHINDFVGNWVNNDSDTSGITRVVVTRAGSHLTVRVFGQCHPVDCDWGTDNADIYTAAVGDNVVQGAKMVVARFNAGFAKKMVILRQAQGDDLRFEALTNFTDSSGRSDYAMTGRLHRQGIVIPIPLPGPGGGGIGGGGGALTEDCISFNNNNVALQNIGGRWKIVDGSMWILDFGANHDQGQRALDIIQHYRFNRQCFVGRPNPSMTYWKRGDSVPSGSMGGDDCTNNNPDTTHAAHVGGEWKVADGGHWMLSFGTREAEARKAEQVIHRYNLNRQCFVGRPNASMTYWLSQH